MIIFTRPDHDVLTNYLKCWSEDLVVQAKKLGVAVVDLWGKKANRDSFISYFKSGTSKNLIFFNGHGNEDVVGGFNDECLLSKNDLKPKIKVVVVYARSCRVGINLGRDMVKAGIKAFIGYTGDFLVYRDTSFTNRPLKDDLAKKFIAPSNYLVSQLLKKKSVGEADKRSKEMMRKEILSLISSGSEHDADTAAYLYSNLNNQVLYGDMEVKILDN